jgi:hypothetical protein
MNLSEEQQRAARKIMRDGFASMPRSGEDEQKRQEITGQVRSDLLKVLNPEQREKFEARLESDQLPAGDRRRPGADGEPKGPPRTDKAGEPGDTAKPTKEPDKDAQDDGG